MTSSFTLSLGHQIFSFLIHDDFRTVGRSWSQRGNVVRFNTFDTIRPTEKLAQNSCSQNAFYLDE